MHIKSLKLENFRSWSKYEIELSPITILIGPNGVGKTNLMESLWLLSTGRSWRTNKDAELIQWDKDYARVVAEIEKNGKESSMELFLQHRLSKDYAQTKVLKVNGVRKRLLDLLGIMPGVLFSPESIEMLDGAPATRRRFLDIMLSEMDFTYATSLGDYNKILKERNKLLLMIKTGHSKEDELEFWDEKLAEAGKIIIGKRKKAIGFFNKHLTEAYEALSGKDEKLVLRYKETVDPDRFEETLFAHHEREIQQTSTLIGPHRDDWTTLLNNRDITTFGSRGEFRTAVLALITAQLRYLEQEMGEKPVLLLDDIFSELDADRRAKLANIVQNQQTIITTTDLDHIEKGLREKAKIVKIGVRV